MTCIQGIKQAAEQAVAAEIDRIAVEMIKVLDAQDVKTRSAVIGRIAAVFCGCGERLERGYCPRCER